MHANPSLHSHRPDGPSRRWRRQPGAGWLLVAALGVGACNAFETARAAEPPRGGGVVRAAARPWWSAYGGDAIEALVRSAEREARNAGRTARNDSPPVAFRTMQAYVALKADTLSLRYIEQARQAAKRQHRLMLAKTLDHDDFARELVERLRRADALWVQQTRQRDHDLATLAALCGMTTGQVTALLQPSLDDAAWPSRDFAVPASIPEALLAERPDVGLALSLRVAANDVLAVAADEADEALARLRVQRAVALSVGRQVAAARAAFEAAQRRRDSEGRFPEVQALEDLQTLLAALRASAIADAELARAWIGLTLSLGGTALTQGLPEPERSTPAPTEARAISNLPAGLPR